MDKKSYVNKKAYEKKYDLSIKNNEGFWKKKEKDYMDKTLYKVKNVKYSKTDVKINGFTMEP